MARPWPHARAEFTCPVIVSPSGRAKTTSYTLRDSLPWKRGSPRHVVRMHHLVVILNCAQFGQLTRAVTQS
ncbi:hypothetical protein GW17_00043646 [Ensete ventricosum]|nr:hypothetical protein GW17_00043646 [Ensete ventricosum]